MQFIAGFTKIAAPRWFYEMHQQMPRKAVRAHSKKGLMGLLMRRGIR